MDDLSPEEEDMYLNGTYNYQSGSTKSERGDDYIDQYENKAPVKQQRRSYMLQENKFGQDYDDNDDAFDYEEQQYSGAVKHMTIDDKDFEEHPIIKHYEFLVPITRMGAGRTIIPRHVQNAATQLIHASSIGGGSFIKLNAAARNALVPLTNQIDEFTSVDPSVIISCTLPITDSFRSFLEEIVSFSEYILIHVLDARFCVVVSDSAKTQPISFKDPDLGLKIRPYAGEEEEELRGQPFGVRDAITSASQHLSADSWTQLEAYMLSLGKLSPTSVCDQQFIEDHMAAIKDIISGKTRIVNKRQRKDGTTNKK